MLLSAGRYQATSPEESSVEHAVCLAQTPCRVTLLGNLGVDGGMEGERHLGAQAEHYPSNQAVSWVGGLDWCRVAVLPWGSLLIPWSHLQCGCKVYRDLDCSFRCRTIFGSDFHSQGSSKITCSSGFHSSKT